LASEINDKDKRAAARTYAKIPEDIRLRFVPVAVRDELGESVEQADGLEPIEEAVKRGLDKMLPWADDPEFGGTNAI
jgi:hypothetical protein